MNLHQYLPARECGSSIPLAPLLDVVLLVLLFVLMVSRIDTRQGIPVELAQASSSQQVQAKSVVLTIDGQGDYWLDGNKVAAADLQSRLRELRQSTTKLVLLRADRTSSVQALTYAMDGIRLAGGLEMILETRNDQGRSKAN